MHPVTQLDNWSLWAHPNPSKCLCRGYGWLRSDYDTVHACGLHKGAPHPEDDRPFDFDLHRVQILRKAYRYFRSVANVPNFRARCAAILSSEDPVSWVDAADQVAEEIVSQRCEEEAHRLGYSCDLERRLDEEAAAERSERWRCV